MNQQSSPSLSFKDTSLSARTRAAPRPIVPPDTAARDRKGHFTQPFRLVAMRYALARDETRKQAATDMGLSSKSISD